jgi:hypothetical protein
MYPVYQGYHPCGKKKYRQSSIWVADSRYKVEDEAKLYDGYGRPVYWK